MSRRQPPEKKPPSPQRPRRRIRARAVTMAVVMFAVATIVVWTLAAGPRGSDATSARATGTPIATGEVIGASGVRVDAAQVDLGRVPLNVAVNHAFRVSNDGVAPVRLGRATIAVLEGC